MTLSDTDLEARLRHDLRARADAAPRAPRDLAELTRQRAPPAAPPRSTASPPPRSPRRSSSWACPIARLDPRRRRRPRTDRRPRRARSCRLTRPLRTRPPRGALAGDRRVAGRRRGAALAIAGPSTASTPAWTLHRSAAATPGTSPTPTTSVAAGSRWSSVCRASDVVHAWFTGPRRRGPRRDDRWPPTRHPYGSDVVALVDAAGPEADDAHPGRRRRPRGRRRAPAPVAWWRPTARSCTGSRGRAAPGRGRGRRPSTVHGRSPTSMLDGHASGDTPGSTSCVSQGVSARPSAVQAVPADPRGVRDPQRPAPFRTSRPSTCCACTGSPPTQAPPHPARGRLADRAREYDHRSSTGITFPSGATTMLLVTYAPTGRRTPSRARTSRSSCRSSPAGNAAARPGGRPRPGWRARRQRARPGCEAEVLDA